MTGVSIVALDGDEALVAELHRLDIRHLARLKIGELLRPMSPEDLIAGLAASADARVQTALILLFLRRPSLSAYVRGVLPRLDDQAANALRLYYQAAVYLRRDLVDDLQRYSDDVVPLPDFFSAQLGLPAPGTITTDVALTTLGQVHARLSGWAYNWAGSYRQNIPRFLKHLRQSYGHHQS